MKKSILIAIVAIIVIVVIAGGYIACTTLPVNPSASPTPSATPEAVAQEECRETVIMFIERNHNPTESLTQGITWSGGRQDNGGMLGSDKYIYTGNGWNVTIQSPVIVDPTYSVSATYTAGDKVVVDWQGTYFHGEVNETSFTYNP